MSRGARAGRGAAIAAFATFVASLAHTIGGGDLPGPLAVLLALAFSTPLAVLLTGPRFRVLRTALAAAVAQAALHLLYAAGGAWSPVSSAAATSVGGTVTGQGGHAGHAASVVELSSGAPAVDHGHGLFMPLAHVVAAALTVVFIAVADRAIESVAVTFGTAVRGIRMLVAMLGELPVAVPPGLRAATVDRVIAPNPEALLLSSLRHRGPPVASFAA
jgi:hypothetical protein